MRRGMLLAVFALAFPTLFGLAFPTAASATTVASTDPTFVTGTFMNVIGSSISRTVNGGFGTGGSTFFVGVAGSMNTIRTTGAILGVGCNVGGSGSCVFNGGTVTVTPFGSTTPVFTSSLANGMITKTSDTAAIFANLVPNPSVAGGSFVNYVVSFNSTAPFTERLIAGTASVTVVPVPEPGTLGLFLLGTLALIGLAGLRRRKLNLRKFKPADTGRLSFLDAVTYEEFHHRYYRIGSIPLVSTTGDSSPTGTS